MRLTGVLNHFFVSSRSYALWNETRHNGTTVRRKGEHLIKVTNKINYLVIH